MAAVFDFFFTRMRIRGDRESNRRDDGEIVAGSADPPLGKYPELVTYTIGRLGTQNRLGMPAEDTYENNNYTRYLRRILNVQNKDIFELANVEEYQGKAGVFGGRKNLPDVMLVTDKTLLDWMVEERSAGGFVSSVRAVCQ